MKKNQDPFLKGILTLGVLVVVGMSLGVGAKYVGAWTEPGSAPPNGNVAAPINASGITQTKAGTFQSGLDIVATRYLRTTTGVVIDSRDDSANGIWQWYSPTADRVSLWRTSAGDRMNVYSDGHAVLGRSTNDADSATTIVTKDYLLSKIGTGGGVGGAGTTNVIPVWTAASTLGNSIMSQAASQVNINGSLSTSQDLVANGGKGRLYFQGGEGEVLRLTGNNGQNMHIQSLNGRFRLVNHPWSAEIFNVAQNGDTYVAGSLGVGNGVVTNNGYYFNTRSGSGQWAWYSPTANEAHLWYSGRGDAFNVYGDGMAVLGRSTTAGDTGRAVATKDYVDGMVGGGGAATPLIYVRKTYYGNPPETNSAGALFCPSGYRAVMCQNYRESPVANGYPFGGIKFAFKATFTDDYPQYFSAGGCVTAYCGEDNSYSCSAVALCQKQ